MEHEPNRGTAELFRSGAAPPETADRELSAQPRGDAMPLLSDERTLAYRERWEECQRYFVDEPRRSVEAADELVADVIRDLAAQFAQERQRLEGQWDRGEEVGTEELRQALMRYRSFFQRLLSI